MANHKTLPASLVLRQAVPNLPLKNMASPSGYPLGGGTLLSMYPRIALVILSKAFVPYCREESQSNMKNSSCLKKKDILITFRSHFQSLLISPTLFSKLYLLRSLDSVALLSPWVNAPCTANKSTGHQPGLNLETFQ